jgi:hypothetical protein
MLRLVAPLVLFLAVQPSAALTVTEPFPGDWGDTFADRAEIVPGADRIQGFLVQSFEDIENPIFDLRDFFALTDLLPGAAFSLTAQTSAAQNTGILILDDAEGIVVPEVIFDGEEFPVLAGIVPASGTIVIRMSLSGEDAVGYQLDIDAPRVIPEPATALLVGLGLAVLGARTRRA